MHVYDLPTITFMTTKNNTKYDPYQLVSLISKYAVDQMFVEDVYSSPQMGVVSAFAFGEGKGVLIGLAAALALPLTLVKPAAWKKAMRVPADKAATVLRASQLFPKLKHQFTGPRGGLIDGRAEASLIAFFGALEMGKAPSKILEPLSAAE